MRSSWTQVIIHLSVWLLLIFVPLFIQIENENVNMRFMHHVWLMLLQLLITVYFNYFWAIDKLLYKRRYVYFVLVNIAVFVVLTYMSDIANCLLNDLAGIPPRHKAPSKGMRSIFIYNNLIFFVLGVGVSMSIKYARRLAESENERQRLESEKLTSEISLLKYQMQPHFFFNTLNNIYALIGKSPADAQRSVMSLSKMMRYILYENTTQFISLGKEMEFLSNYASLMRIRMGDKINVEMSISDNCEHLQIPPLMLIPMLENAFKHGVSPQGHSVIRCSLQFDGERVSFEVINTLPGIPSEDRSHSGIGIVNLRKRLEIMYGSNFVFETGPSDDGHYRAFLQLPVNQI